MTTVETQLEHLDDADIYATAWSDALESFYDAQDVATHFRWGGRGQGGRGLARRTVQPMSVSIPNLRLEYANATRVLLDDAALKISSSHVYGLVGGSRGKSSLMRRLAAHKIPGLPPHLTTLYIHPQDISPLITDNVIDATTPIDWLQHWRREYITRQNNRNTDEELDSLQSLLDSAVQDFDEEAIEDITNRIELLEERETECSDTTILASLCQMGIEELASLPINHLSPGQLQKMSLSRLILCKADIVLLDCPTFGLDIEGLLRLRATVDDLCKNNESMILIASNDIDFLNGLCTDIIELTNNSKLQNYQGNYWDCSKVRSASERHHERQEATRDKKAAAMVQTLDHLRRQPVPKRGGMKKKSKQVNSHKRRMERVLGRPTEKDEEKEDGTHSFRFEPCNCQWNEPIVFAMDIGHRLYSDKTSEDIDCTPNATTITKKPGFMFDCVDLCIEEQGRYCIVGANASGKSTLLSILAGDLQPTEGKLVHAIGLEVGYVSLQKPFEQQQKMDAETTPLAHLKKLFPLKSEQEIRGEMTRFGLSAKLQSGSSLNHLSDGERFRFQIAAVMLRRPPILFLDDPTVYLDTDSINALVGGLNDWNGTLLVVSHDTHFLRSIERIQCYVLLADCGKLLRVEGGTDEYIRSYCI